MHLNLNNPNVYTYAKHADAERIAKHIGAKVYRKAPTANGTQHVLFMPSSGLKPGQYLTFADIQSAIHSANTAPKKEPIMAKNTKSAKPSTTVVSDDLTGDETVVTHNTPAETKPSKKAKPVAAPVEDDLTGDAKPSKKGKKSAIQADAKFKATDVETREGSCWKALQASFGRRANGITVDAAFAAFKFVQPRGNRASANPRAFFVSVVSAGLKKGYIAAI